MDQPYRSVLSRLMNKTYIEHVNTVVIMLVYVRDFENVQNFQRMERTSLDHELMRRITNVNKTHTNGHQRMNEHCVIRWSSVSAIQCSVTEVLKRFVYNTRTVIYTCT